MTCVHTLDLPDGGTEELKSVTTLISNDGTVMTRNIDKVKSWACLDGIDPMELMTLQMPERVQVTVKMDPGFRDPSRL